MKWRIPLADIDFDSEEKAAVEAVLEGRWLTMGAETSTLEAEFAAFTGSRQAIAVTNGTAALHLACLAVELGPGAEAIVPSLTFVATAAAVKYAGATPVFADIVSADDLNLDPDSVARLISPRTRAIVVVHYGGYPCDMDRILALAREHDLAVIEDAAHAPGAELNGRKLGTFGDVSCFSFFSNKNLTTAEGGMLVTDDEAIAQKMRLLRSHAMTTLTWDRHQGHAWSYDVVDLGFNYRLDELRAALGRVQLRKLARNNQRRQALTVRYHDLLSKRTPEITIPFKTYRGVSSCHLLPVLLPGGKSRVNFMEGMKALGIQTSVHYPPIHQFPYYQSHERSGPAEPLTVTENVAAREVTLPLYANLSPDEVDLVVQSVHEVLDGI